MFGQQCFIGECARRDNPSNLAFDGAFAGCRVAHLLADCYRLTLANQFRQVALGGMVGNASHWDWIATGFSARCQRDVHERRRHLRVVIKKLVEVTHAVEHQHVRVVCLDCQVLAHHRRVDWGDFGGHSYLFIRVGALLAARSGLVGAVLVGALLAARRSQRKCSSYSASAYSMIHP